MNLQYSLHALGQINERKIDRIWVEETIKYPDTTQVSGIKNYAIKKINGKTLKVIYVKEEKYIKIITSFYLK